MVWRNNDCAIVVEEKNSIKLFDCRNIYVALDPFVGVQNKLQYEV